LLFARDSLLAQDSVAGAASMLKKLKIVGFSALIFASASAVAKDRGLPTIDIQKGCRAAEVELTALFGNQSDAYKSCINDEQAARDQLVKDWDTFSAFIKSRCVQPGEYLPSYVEWQTCLEMTRDVMKLRASDAETVGQSTGRKSGKGRTGPKTSKTRECPVVEVGVDGNVNSVDAC
jgi:hypothetical protein